MKKPNVTRFMKNAQVVLSKHSPEILTGIGIAGMITTTVMAVKATPKALTLIEEKKKEEKTDKLSPVDTVKAAWKPYIPSVIMGVASTACLIGASSVNLRRNTALATAYALSETAFSEYKEKVIETVGEKKEQVIKDAVAKEHIEKNPVSNNVIITGKGDTLCLDGVFGSYFKSDIEKIRKAVNEMNYRLQSEMYISVNEFYYELGIPRIGAGDDIGWNIEEGLIDIDFSSQLTDDGTPCLVMEYHVAPRYDYRNLH